MYAVAQLAPVRDRTRKSELLDADAAAELLEERIGRPVMKISAVTGRGLPQLLQATIRLLDELEEIQE